MPERCLEGNFILDGELWFSNEGSFMQDSLMMWVLISSLIRSSLKGELGEENISNEEEPVSIEVVAIQVLFFFNK